VNNPNYQFQITNYLLPLFVVATVFERFNVFVEPLDFSLKLSLILLPIVGLVLLVKRRLTFNPTFLFPFLAAVVGVEVLSIPFAYDRFQSFQVVVFHLLMVGLFYLLVWAQLGRETGVRSQELGVGGRQSAVGGLDSVVGAWGVGALIVSFLGFWQFCRYFAGQSPAVFLDRILAARSLGAATFTQTFFGRSVLRPSSTFIDANTAASFVGVALILSLGFALGSDPIVSLKGCWRKKGQALLVVPCIVFLAMALSRSATLGLAIGLAAFAVLNLWGRVRKGFLVAAVAGFLLAVSVGIGYLSISKPERMESSLGRIEYVRGAAEMLRHNPFLGVGAGNFERYYTEVINPAEEFGYSHSIFLTWLGETGILGLAANLALIGAVVVVLGREVFRHRVGTAWRVRLSTLLAAFLALVVANIFHAHYGLEFTWVLLGLSVSGYYLAKESGGRSQESGAEVLGVKIDNVDMDEAIRKVRGFFKSGKKAYVVTPNPEMVMLARRDSEFQRILNGADLAIPDGIGLVWASRILGRPLRSRVTGTDLFQELCAEAARRGGKVFLLGAGRGVAEKAARKLRRRYQKLRIAGTFAGDASPKGDKETVAAVKAAAINNQQSTINNIDLLFVAYGCGKQEKWIARNLKKVPVKVAVGVGGAFDFVAGDVPRAPRIIRRFGFEWLYRLVRQPWRLRRQLALIPFAALVFSDSLRRPVAESSS